MIFKINIPDDIIESIYDAFTYRQDDFDDQTQTKKEYTENKILSYIKEVTLDYIVNIETIDQVKTLKDAIKDATKIKIDKIKIDE